MPQAGPVRVDGTVTCIDNVAFVDSPQSKTIRIVDGLLSEITDSPTSPEWIALPPLCEEHVHANRAFTLGPERPDSFDHAVAITLAQLAEFSADQYSGNAGRLFGRALHHGTTRVRTHADVDPAAGLRAVEGTLRAAESMRGKLEVDVVACASTRADTADSETLGMLRDAAAMGCTHLGAVPVFYTNPRRSIDGLMQLAGELDLPVDVHQDEHLNAGKSWSEYLADATIANDLRGRVCLSHGCALAVLDQGDLNRVIDRLVEAEISVIALPLTNLYLQDRGKHTPRSRGVTTVHELLEAGVPVRFASDNVCDVFYPYGDADLLETAFVASLVTQLDNPVQLVQGICGGEHRLETGDPANLVLVEGNSLHDVLRRRPDRRIVLRNGALWASLSGKGTIFR